MKPQTFECWAYPSTTDNPILNFGPRCPDGFSAARITVTPIEEKPMPVTKEQLGHVKGGPDAQHTDEPPTPFPTSFAKIVGEINNPVASPPRLRQPSEPWDGSDYYTFDAAKDLTGWSRWQPRDGAPDLLYIPAVEFDAWIARGTDQAKRIAELEGQVARFRLLPCKPRWRKPEEWTEKDGLGVHWIIGTWANGRVSLCPYYHGCPLGPWLSDADVIATLGRPEEEKPTPPLALSSDDPPEELRVGMAVYYRHAAGGRWFYGRIAKLKAGANGDRVEDSNDRGCSFPAREVRVHPPKLEESK